VSIGAPSTPSHGRGNVSLSFRATAANGLLVFASDDGGVEAKLGDFLAIYLDGGYVVFTCVSHRAAVGML